MVSHVVHLDTKVIKYQILDQFPVRLLITAIYFKCANDWHVSSIWFFVWKTIGLLIVSSHIAFFSLFLFIITADSEYPHEYKALNRIIR